MQRAGAAARLSDALRPFLTEPIEHGLRGPVGMRRVRQCHDRFLDAAGVLETQHLAARDAGGVGVDVAADAEQLPSNLEPTPGVALEPVVQLRAVGEVEHPNRVGVEVALDA